MGDVMEAADPEIKNTLLKCMRQPSTTLSVQQAAIQAFRRMSLTDEVTLGFIIIFLFFHRLNMVTLKINHLLLFGAGPLQPPEGQPVSQGCRAETSGCLPDPHEGSPGQ